MPIITTIATIVTSAKVGSKPPKDQYFHGVWIFGLPYGTYDHIGKQKAQLTEKAILSQLTN